MLTLTECARKNLFEEADRYLSKMTPQQKIGQLLMFAVPGSRLGIAGKTLMKKYLPGGIVLFGYNGTEAGSVKKFISDFQACSIKKSGIPLFVSIDQEGGKVKRIRRGLTQFPGNMAAGAVGKERYVYQWARTTGIELRRIGINMNLAPVLDVNNNPDNPVINTRSFGSDVETVSTLGSAYIRGLQDSRCIAVGKHFPGHGDTDKDSHLILPVIRFDMDRLKKIELAPFRAAIDNNVECIMTAHIAYPAILGNMESATVSRRILTDLLRNEMGFKGIIITDDLEMHAIAKNMKIGEAALKSVLAGTDIILISSYGKNVANIHATLTRAYKKGTLTRERLDSSVRRIIEMKIRYGIMAPPAEPGEKKKDNSFSLTRDDYEFIEYAKTLNKRITRASICYKGSLKDIQSPAAAKRLFILEEKMLRGVIAPDKNDRILPSLKKLETAGKLKNPGKATVAVYAFYRPVEKRIRYFTSLCRKKGFRPLIVCTANPFPALKAGDDVSVLMSFSNTPESIRALGAALAGELEPRPLSHVIYKKTSPPKKE